MQKYLNLNKTLLVKTIVAISHFLFNSLFAPVYGDLHKGWNSWSTLNPSFVLCLTLMSKMKMLIPSADTWFPSFLLLSETFVFSVLRPLFPSPSEIHMMHSFSQSPRVNEVPQPSNSWNASDTETGKRCIKAASYLCVLSLCL